uniref:Tudor domain-containing protein n=1 Tax=Amphiprion percula TaxID=161767 RepID=A0A3P8SU54_AMPPE
MCSIPGLPTPGSEVPVLITRVNLNPSYGLVELWVNLDDGRKHVYETVREEIQIIQRKFYATEGKPGDLCLVCISDTWHRARIVSIETERFNVFLIDQGKPHITTREALAWGHCDSFVLPPEIESCILANVLSLENNQPEKANKFLTSLTGKKFKGLVQHVLMPDRMILLDIPIVSKHMCRLGSAQKIPVDEFKSLVLKCLHLPKEESSEDFHKSPGQNLNVGSQLTKQYFYPELLTDALEIVTVTEVTDPLNIFCKLQIFLKAVETLSEQIHQYYEKCSNSEEAQPQTCGEPCAAKGTNGRWHRSILKQNMVTSDSTVEVLHVDEGKTELIPVGDIKPLLVKFLRMPVVTYLCSLNEIKDNGKEWTVDEIDFLKSLLLNQTVTARFDHQTETQDAYSVTLYAANAECINNSFMEKAGLIPHSRPDLNVQSRSINSTILTPTGDENKLNGNVDELPEETKKVIKGSTDDASTSATNDIHIKESSKYQNHNGHISTGFPSEEHIACGDDVFTVGSTVNVKVSCIDGRHKFWCQTTENSDSLQCLMKDIQNHYESAHPRPLTETICVARHPDNNMWYRAKIIANHHSPTVDVRFIDYGQTQKVPLQDVQPIDPMFLQLKAQAFQCCLFNQKSLTDVTLQNATLVEFQKCVDLRTSSNIEVKCVVKAVTSDDEGLLLNMVDIETASDSASKLLAQRCAQSDVYNYSTHNIEVGAKEKVWVTSSESINLFYCQLFRNSHWFDKVMENVAQLLDQPQCSDQPLGLNSICLAKYSDDQWYRGQVVEMSPKLKVHFVDYGNTLAVNETDIRPCPTEVSMTRSIPVQAVPLGLFDVPAEIPPEVNRWFADHAVGHNFTISVVAQEEKGKFIVELFDGSLNVNEKARERMAKMKEQLTDQQLSNSSKLTTAPNVPQELMEASELTKTTQQDRVRSMFARDDLQMGSKSTPDTLTPKSFDEGNNPALDAIIEYRENVAETSVQSFHSDSEVARVLKEEVYVSCIVGPNYFWCQYSNTEDLNTVSKLAQEAGQAQQDRFFLESLEPGSPCLALFSSDNQWYRAQVIRKAGNTFHIVFVDYGNESEVDIENVKPLPQSLLDIAPQAFMCRLKEFNESKGSWNDEVYDDFYNLVIDKPLKVTIFNMENHSEIAVPQYAVEIECDKVVINRLMQKYWRPFSTEQSKNETPLKETQDTETGGNATHFHISKENTSTCKYKKPIFSKNKAEMVHASSIVEPYFFWCQYTNTEDLCKVIQLAQEAGQSDQDITFAETLGPGSPCLALFSSDNQWYRAQVIRRFNDAFCVLFVDYGNESEVDIKDVRSLPQTLLEITPQAFLCRLDGFDESKGSWDDKASDGFYNLLVDKPLKLTVFSMEDHPEIKVSQFSVEIDCEGVVVNIAMQTYWKLESEKRLSSRQFLQLFSLFHGICLCSLGDTRAS